MGSDEDERDEGSTREEKGEKGESYLISFKLTFHFPSWEEE